MSDRILRLQHVEVRVPDLELCTAYYTEVVGLIEVAHDEGRVFLKCWDEHEHHSVVLRQAPTYGLDHVLQGRGTTRPGLLHRPGGEGRDRRQALRPGRTRPRLGRGHQVRGSLGA